MKNRRLHETILRAARKLPEDACVPYLFEKRITAHLAASAASPPDSLALWSRGLWQATVPCLALMIFAIGAWSLLVNEHPPTMDPLATDIELTMMQPFDELDIEELW